MFNKKFFKSVGFNIPIICVGNLSLGGTGKSPMVEHILSILSDDYKIATLSRGYKRKTKGYALAGSQTTALEIGDEPMQFHIKYPNVSVAVCERRIEAIPQLIQDVPNLSAIILDDAFQHRVVQAGFNILLTEYSDIYTNDFFLPTGNLRDEWKSAKRANIIVVTKCPSDLSQANKYKTLRSLKPNTNQKVYFTSIEYGIPYHIYNKKDEWVLTSNDEVLLVCGIANPKPLKEYLLNNTHVYYQKDFSDHHIFSIEDLNEIKNLFHNISSKRKIILTTEKDAVRLTKFTTELEDIPLYVLPIKHRFLFEEGEQFNSQILSFVSNFTFNPKL